MDPKEKPVVDSSLPDSLSAVESEPAMPRSRISRAMENQARRNIIVAGVGILFIILLISFFGVRALQKLSDISVKSKDNASVQTKVDTAPLLPPTLQAPFEATSSADVKITGQVQNADSVKLYINDAFSDKTTVKKDNTFEFPDVTLSEGDNSIKAKAVRGSKESDFSDEVHISYFSKAPSLDISSPADGRTFNHDQNPILVSGKTDPEADVLINDHRAIMETDGNFSYTLNLNDGDNDIKIVARDQAGNATEKHVKVTLH